MGGTAAQTVASAAPTVVRHDGIEYAIGGVGVGSRDAIARMADQFNTRFTFAAGDDRHLLVDVDVRIVDASGSTRFTTADAGPMFYMKLPAGTYEVHARYQGQQKIRRIEVKAGGAPVREAFRW